MINGKIKFFTTNLITNDISTITTSDNTEGSFLLSSNNEWISETTDTDDAVVITIDLHTTVSANRILILNHNLESFVIAANNSFVNAKDINNNNALNGNIIFGRNDDRINTSYYAFDSMELNQITFTLNFPLTEGTPVHKRIGQFILCNELGTFAGYPVIKNINFMNNSKTYKSKAGGVFMTKQLDTVKIGLDFKNYNHKEDIDLINFLHRRQEDFLVWLSGGREKNFRFPVEGYRLEDVYKMNISKSIKQSYDRGSYTGLLKAVVDFEEVV